MPFRFLFVMDPLAAILPDKDTTFVFMLESLRRGHEVYTCEVRDLFVEALTPSARVRRTEVLRVEPHYAVHDCCAEPLTNFQAIFMRKDPPVDQAYLFATYILGLVDPRRTFVLNNPRGLRDANEKLYTLHFPTAIPTTLVTSDNERLRSFLASLEGPMIIKPLDGCGGSGVFLLHQDDRNTNALLEVATANGSRLIMAQRYIPEIRDGDKRIILLNGEPLGAVLRVPRSNENRGNIHVGGAVRRADLTERDLELIAIVAQRIRQDGLYFVGLDVIGPYLTEVNVTSPTGVQEINALTGACLESAVIDFVEQHCPV